MLIKTRGVTFFGVRVGFLDWLFRKKKEKTVVETSSATISVEELERRIREARSAALKKYEPSFAEKAAVIAAEAKAVLPLLEGLSKKGVDESNANYKIAVQERDGYVTRMKPLLVQLANRPQAEPLTAYADVLSSTISAMLKTTSDNRYVFIFFADEMAKIGEHMKKLGELSEQVNEITSKLRADSAAFDKVLLECAELEAISAERRKLVSELARAEVDYGEVKKGFEEASAKFPLQDAQLFSRELSSAEAEASAARQALANELNLFQRALRKLQKVCLDKRLAALAALYAETPVDAVINEFRATADYKELRELLEALADGIEASQLSVDEKERLKLLGEATKVSSGAIKPFLEKFVAASSAAEKARQKLVELDAKKQALSLEEQRVAELSSRVQEIEKKIGDAANRENALLSSIEQAALQLLNQKISVKRD